MELKRSDPDVEITWKAFELRPEPVPSLDPSGEYLTRVWRDSVYPLAERLGIVMRLPPVQPRSRRAHEASKWARQQGGFDRYNAALFRALFEKGEDIGRAEVLLKLAADVGLGVEGLRRALEAKEFESSVLTDEREAAELAVSGVPAFIAERRVALSGVQILEGLRQLVNRARSMREP